MNDYYNDVAINDDDKQPPSPNTDLDCKRLVAFSFSFSMEKCPGFAAAAKVAAVIERCG